MPKDRRGRSVSSERSRVSPFPCSSSRTRCSSSKNPLEPVEDTRELEEARRLECEKSLESAEDIKEWEEARCPVCMEHPHNAVLLLCSSHDKGCRPYMCDTSYRHSNCLDQFRKAFADSPSTIAQDSSPNSISSDATTPMDTQDVMNEQASNSSTLPSAKNSQSELACPLCRGKINGWHVVEAARQLMNAKARSCACETCDFCGTYSDLRKHARLQHPLVRPSEADPERERDWRNLERQRDLGDVLSTIQSAFVEERSEDEMLAMDNGGLLTVFFLIRVFRPGSSTSGNWSGASIVRGQPRSRRRRVHWGESNDIDAGSASVDDESNPLERISRAWRRRVRSQRRPTPENQP
ncbi:uncharacterized protein LOC122085521 [Macadamia integrifolia]|uniref:uncharacterized protein LOC122085521 n=1 Tax=Macadamia integrifolia TaxID=60698 RepID=UPI001C4F60D1|nr:uncharacterized protein LOC122085521 [Macadamia integrifolia]